MTRKMNFAVGIVLFALSLVGAGVNVNFLVTLGFIWIGVLGIHFLIKAEGDPTRWSQKGRCAMRRKLQKTKEDAQQWLQLTQRLRVESSGARFFPLRPCSI